LAWLGQGLAESTVEVEVGLTISDKKIIIGLIQRNSGCSAKHKTLGIPFRTIPQRSKILGILYCETKIEATLGIPFCTIQRKRKQLRIPFRKKIEANT
jgi:hypothetical protein